MVEHNRNFLKLCDEIIFLGPGAGKDGGFIVKKDENIVYQFSRGLRSKIFIFYGHFNNTEHILNQAGYQDKTFLGKSRKNPVSPCYYQKNY